MQNPSLKDLNLSLDELKRIAELLAEKRGVKGYKDVPKCELLNALTLSKQVKKVKSQK